MTNRKEKNLDVKNKLLGKSLQLFSEKGFEGTSIRVIAKECNISLGLLYNYFDSKESLLKAIYNEGKQDIIKSFEVPKKSSIELEFEEYLNNIEYLLNTRSDFWRMIHTIRHQKNIQIMLSEEIQETSSIIFESLNYFISQKAKDNQQANILFFFAMIDGAIAHSLLIPNYDFQQIKSIILQAFKDLK